MFLDLASNYKNIHFSTYSLSQDCLEEVQKKKHVLYEGMTYLFFFYKVDAFASNIYGVEKL